MTSPPSAVTIGIPFYNCASYLLDAIRSVFAQTHQDWELILVDDGSSDNSLEIASSICDPRVRVISDGRNLGLAARLNQITAVASHDLVARMDADDLMHPERLARQTKLLEASSDIDLVGTGTYSTTSDVTLVGVRSFERVSTRMPTVVAGNCGLIHASVIYRREWALRNPYDPAIRRSEDIDLWARALARGDFRSVTIPEPLYVYREDLNVRRDKLLAAYATERACSIRYIRDPLSLIQQLGLNIAKTAVVTLFFSSQLQRALQRRRNPSPLTSDATDAFASMMEIIRNTPVPRQRPVSGIERTDKPDNHEAVNKARSRAVGEHRR